MANKDVFVASAYIASKQKSADKFLLTGKIEHEDHPEGFLFYLIELPASIKISRVPKKIITSLRSFDFSTLDLEKSFEILLSGLNKELNELAKNGDNDWVGGLNALIGFVYQGQIGISQSGKILGYIFRKGKISTITEDVKGGDPHPLKTFIDVTLGKISPEDRLIFGNFELFNHLSLSRVREVVCETDAKGAAFHLCSFFKKNKWPDANAIILNASETEFEKDNCAEIFYTDEPEETFLHKLQKTFKPIYENSIKPAAMKLADFSKKHGATITHKTKEAWQNDLAPSAKKLLKKSAESIASKKDKKKLPDTLPKSHSAKTNFYQSFKSGQHNYFSYLLRNTWDNLSKILIPKNRKFLYAALVLIFLVISFIKLTHNNSTQSGEKKEQELVLDYDKANEQFNKTKDDIALGRAGDQVAALSAALELSQKAEASKSKTNDAKKLSTEIKASLDKLSNTTRIYSSDPSSLFNKGVKKVILAGQDIFGLTDEGKIYSINTNDKETKLVGSLGKDNAALSDLDYSADQKKIYFLTTAGKIIEFDPSTTTSGEIKPSDGTWKPAVALSSYTTNAYLVDTGTGTIWKYVRADTGFGKASTYIDGKKTNIKDAIDLAIDGNLWVLKKTGEVAKFSRGAVEPFTLSAIKGADTKMTNPVKIATDSDSNQIYILDAGANRIVRFSKSGEFINQYYFDGGTLDDFVVNSKVQKMWLLSDGNIYEVKL